MWRDTLLLQQHVVSSAQLSLFRHATFLPSARQNSNVVYVRLLSLCSKNVMMGYSGQGMNLGMPRCRRLAACWCGSSAACLGCLLTSQSCGVREGPIHFIAPLVGTAFRRYLWGVGVSSRLLGRSLYG